MHTRVLDTEDRRVMIIIADKGDEALAVIGQALRQHGVSAGQITAVGGFRSAEVGYFDRQRRDYDRIPVQEQVEVLSLLGDAAESKGEPVPHLHAVLGRRDGSTVGGHLLRGEVWPTLEVIVTEVAPHLGKRIDPETGLALIAPEDAGALAAPAGSRRAASASLP